MIYVYIRVSERRVLIRIIVRVIVSLLVKVIIR